LHMCSVAMLDLYGGCARDADSRRRLMSVIQ
jgi:hypothetical protein